MKFLKQADFLGFVIAKLSKHDKISIQISLNFFLQKILKSDKGPGTNFQTTFFVELYDKNFSIVIFYLLLKFHYETVFTPALVQ